MTGWASSAMEEAGWKVRWSRAEEASWADSVAWAGLAISSFSFLLYSFLFLLNKPRASMWGPIKCWQFTGIELIKIFG